MFNVVLLIAFVASPLPPVEELPERPELPDPFVMLDGSRVETPEEWYSERRPELKRLFQHYVYGYIPESPGITATREALDTPVLGGKAILRQVEIAFDGLPDDAPRIHLAVFLPADAPEAVPVFLAINKCGNYTVVSDDAVLLNRDTRYHDACPPLDAARGTKEDFWCVEYLIERGYAFATFHESDLDPDKHDFTDGIHPYFDGLPVPPESHWGTIGAWAWGLHRAMDYLSSDEDIDADGICLIGHSRRGKTALFAAAMDERVALVVPHQSGTGGMALSRNNDEETVERINRVFPHWFNDQFPKFSDNEGRLPVDQHLLVALVAPRPLLDTAGLQDTWANYESALRNLRAASPVYEFLGVKGLVGDGVLRGDDAITEDTAGRLLQFRLDTKHTLNQDYWRAILDFADLHLR